MIRRTLIRPILNYVENTFLHDMTRYIEQKSNHIPPFVNWNHKTTNISNYQLTKSKKQTTPSSSYQAYEYMEQMLEKEKNMK